MWENVANVAKDEMWWKCMILSPLGTLEWNGDGEGEWREMEEWKGPMSIVFSWKLWADKFQSRGMGGEWEEWVGNMVMYEGMRICEGIKK
jgi:hypothetical protein